MACCTGLAVEELNADVVAVLPAFGALVLTLLARAANRDGEFFRERVSIACFQLGASVGNVADIAVDALEQAKLDEACSVPRCPRCLSSGGMFGCHLLVPVHTAPSTISGEGKQNLAWVEVLDLGICFY